MVNIESIVQHIYQPAQEAPHFTRTSHADTAPHRLYEIWAFLEKLSTVDFVKTPSSGEEPRTFLPIVSLIISFISDLEREFEVRETE